VEGEVKAGKRRVAYHEAGHAVIARVLGVSVHHVSRFATEGGGTPRALTYSAAWNAGSDSAYLIGLEADAKISLAGPHAEKKYRPDTNINLAQQNQWLDDMANAMSAVVKILLFKANPNDRVYFEGAREIELTSDQSAEATQLFNRISGETQALVEQHWSAIERTAAALLDRSVLNEHDIDALIIGS
jgi:hypothetical protein